MTIVWDTKDGKVQYPFLFTVGGENKQQQQQCQFTRAYKTDKEKGDHWYPRVPDKHSLQTIEPLETHFEVTKEEFSSIGSFSAYCGHSIYIIGGKGTPKRIVKAKYQAQESKLGQFNIMPSSLLYDCYKSACGQPRSEPQFFYVMGGKKDGKAFAECQRYDADQGLTIKLASLNVARHSAGITFDHTAQIIIVAGGVGIDGKELDSIEVYDKLLDHWFLIDRRLGLPKRNIHIINDEDTSKIYVYGGRSKSSSHHDANGESLEEESPFSMMEDSIEFIDKDNTTYYTQVETVYLMNRGDGRNNNVVKGYSDTVPFNFEQCVYDHQNAIAYLVGGTRISNGQPIEIIHAVFIKINYFIPMQTSQTKITFNSDMGISTVEGMATVMAAPCIFPPPCFIDILPNGRQTDGPDIWSLKRVEVESATFERNGQVYEIPNSSVDFEDEDGVISIRMMLKEPPQGEMPR
ncbi:hypothetical protein DFA_03076 [Cavenderia fasciculata]|uniref:Kelch repeat-containing protein n=1 Tax=Cavenderia fasciculata TaxID=261658 RepID=F4PGJ7_CACFS|nr:uncharacterized protein DFA_03076 [Cavenderia fasciculata]EGG24831.1 hypothetical protein DFA_03076 [Cavenderia fasciculata]|eukprot:XP_004362682.1 hypothetical protein DFA_03076 [Cavenderia fasciculata]